MKNGLITPAMVELRAAIAEAEELTGKAELTKRDEARVNVLLSKIASLRQGSVAKAKRDPETVRFFRALLAGKEFELRTNLQAGQQTISYTQGAAGGFLVPNEYADDLIIGMAQLDPLLDEDVVTLVKSKGSSLRPYTQPGWDLSTVAAVKVGEAVQQNAGNIPTATQVLLNGYTYKATLGASFEIEEDDFEPTLDQMTEAFRIALARGIGQDLINGNGTTAPQGIIVGAANSSFTTAGAGALTADDLESIYFKVNRWHRAAEKCAWVFSDAVYQQVRKAHDSNLRPLINIVGDREVLFGKPIYVSPSVSSTAGTPGIVFGNLAHYIVRASQPTIERAIQLPGYVEYGQAAYICRQRIDAKVFDPTAGSVPPIVYATLHA
jgi:HK97 family phage major capsid protein